MTEPEHPAAPETATLGSVFAAMTMDRVAILAGGVLLVIGAIGPWATSPLTSVSGTSINGGDGIVILILGIVLALMGFSRSTSFAWPAVIALAAGVVGVYDLIHIQHQLASIKLLGHQIDHVGWGLYMVLAAVVVSFIGLYHRRGMASPMKHQTLLAIGIVVVVIVLSNLAFSS